jgi:hypothetical protein
VTAWNLPPYGDCLESTSFLRYSWELGENCFNTWGLLGILLLTMHRRLVWLRLSVSLLTVPTLSTTEEAGKDSIRSNILLHTILYVNEI